MLSIIMTYQEMIAAHQDYLRQQILHRYQLSVRSEDAGFRGMQSFDGPVAGVWGADPRGPPDLRERNADARASTHLRAFFGAWRTLYPEMGHLAIIHMLPSNPFQARC